MAKPVTIKILGDASSFDRAMSGVSSKLGGLAKTAGLVGGAIATAGAGSAVAAAQAAVSFESEMAQVFTLLPGISGDAMAEMNEQVLGFSNEIGLLPEEVVPALYDALSAGVPKDNVFSFLETSAEAAIGGNLDLQASVDLLTTATNAYAESGLTASEASDLFFTTVRLGKTTVPELQEAFSSVGPIAASLGVGLDEVGAAMAVLTASGVPTAQAATQVRAVLADLAKTGTKADKAFRELAGESFIEFMESGGSLEEALGMISEGGLEVVDTFGRIEGAGAVMTLLTDDMSAFSAANEEMAGSVGATGDAFGIMENTSARSLERLSSMFATAKVELGTRLLPVLERLIDWGTVNVPKMREAVAPVFEWFGEKLGQLRSGISGEGDEGETSFFARYGAYLREVVWPVLQDVFAWIKENGPKIAELVGAAILFVAEEVMPRAIEVFNRVKDVVLSVVDTVREHWPEIRAVIERVATWFIEDIYPQLEGIFYALRDLVEAVVEQMVRFWERWGEDIFNTVVNAIEPLARIVEAALGQLRAVIETITALIRGDWDAFWDGIKDYLRSTIESLKAVFEIAWGLFKLAFEMAWEALAAVAREAIEAITELVSGLPGVLLDLVTAAGEKLMDAGKSLGGAIFDGFKAVFSGIGTWLWDQVPGWVKTTLGLMGIGPGDGSGRASMPAYSLFEDGVDRSAIPGYGAPPQDNGIVQPGDTFGGLLDWGANTQNPNVNINVTAQTNADPATIASDIAFEMRLAG